MLPLESIIAVAVDAVVNTVEQKKFMISSSKATEMEAVLKTNTSTLLDIDLVHFRGLLCC